MLALILALTTSASAETPKALDPVTLVFCDQPLLPGVPVDEECLYEVPEIPSDYRAAGALTAQSSAVGRVPVREVAADMALREVHFAPPGSPPGMESLVGKGQVAVRIELSHPHTVFRYLDRVDALGRDGHGRCLRADDLRVVGFDTVDATKVAHARGDLAKAVWLAVPEAQGAELASDADNVRLLLRNRIDLAVPSGIRRCGSEVP